MDEFHFTFIIFTFRERMQGSGRCHELRGCVGPIVDRVQYHGDWREVPPVEWVWEPIGEW